jgi:2-dehydropantoate 2-reductase
MLLSLQNGVDNEERIARAAGHSSGVGAAAYVVSAIKAPGVVAQTAGPGKIVLGELGGGKSKRTERLRDVLQNAGIAAEVHPGIRAVLWQKFLFICAFSGVTQAAAVEPWGRGSLYGDLAGGRRLELEGLNGEVVRRGGEQGVETPLNFAIYAALRPYVGGAPALP